MGNTEEGVLDILSEESCQINTIYKGELTNEGEVAAYCLQR